MNQQAKNKRSFPYVAVILWVTVVLVVAILGHTILGSLGIFGRLDKAASSNTIKLNENQVDVYRYHVAQNEFYYQYMYIRSGLMSDPTGGQITSGLMDVGTYIHQMLYAYNGTGMYDATAYDYAEQYLTYCEGAKNDNNLYETYKKEVQADIDQYIQDMKDSAEAGGMSFSSYVDTYIGKGVSKSDIESAMEYYFIGGKYAEKLADGYADEVRDDVDALTNYRDNNKDRFYTTSYTSYKLVSNEMKEAFEKCKTIDEAKTIIVDYYMDQKFDAQYKTNIEDSKDKVEDTAGKDKTREDVRTSLLAKAHVTEYKGKAVFTDADKDSKDAYRKAAYKIMSAINTSVTTQTAKFIDDEDQPIETSAGWVDVNPLKEDGSKDEEAYDKLSDLQKWLFGEGRRTGETNLIETKTTSKDKDGKETTTYSYTWYIVGEEVMHLDEEHTKNAYYFMFTDDDKKVENAKTGKEKAEAFHKALSAAPSPEKFTELMKEYAPNTAIELIENISYESMRETYKGLADWLYDKDRKENEVSHIIENTKKNTTTGKDEVNGYIVALYQGENPETWKVNATNAIAGEKLEAWYEEHVKKYNVVVDYEPETTAETETK